MIQGSSPFHGPAISPAAGLLRWHLAQVRRPWELDDRQGKSSVPMMKLQRLLEAAGLRAEIALPEMEVSGVTCDSRYVGPGNLFVALPGEKTDGLRYVPEAVRRGAVAVLIPKGAEVPTTEVPVFTTDDPRRLLARLAARFHGSPSEDVAVAGITGTNGKTTVAWLLRSALDAAGLTSGLVGTIGHDTGPGSYDAENTTPGADRLQALLAEMRDAGRKACAMEVSSHALVQGRVDEVRFRCGVFTNLSREHLDYHPSMEEYLDAKAELFRLLAPEAVAVLNADDPASEILAEETRARIVTYGIEHGGDYRARIHRMDAGGTVAEITTPLGTVDISTRLLGRHNLSNALAALAAAVALGADLEEAAAGVGALQRVPGRLERLAVETPFSVLIDYAHTPDALRQVLRYLRPLTSGRLWLLFGCGGDRDPGKRPVMARIAERWADAVMVTSDNPRTEHPMAIIRDVMGGFESPREVLLEPDRAKAIRTVLELASPGDVVLLAGKGHENYQIIGKERVAHSDAEIVQEFAGGA